MRFDKNSATSRSGVFMNFNTTIEHCVISPSSHFFSLALPLTSSSKLQLKCRAIFLYAWVRYVRGDIDDNNSTSSFANRERLAYIYYKWNHTRFSPYSRIQNGIWNILFRLDAKQCQQQHSRKHTKGKENKYAHIFIIITFAKWFGKVIQPGEWASTYMRISLWVWPETRQNCSHCVFVFYCWEMEIYECNLQRIQIDFFRLPFICVWNTHIFLQLLRVSNILLHKCVIIIIVPHPFDWHQKLLHISSLPHSSLSLSLCANSIWNISFAFNFYF